MEELRLREGSRQARAVLKGLGCIVPLQPLRLFTWQELEVMVCGKPGFDVGLLRSATEYKHGCKQGQPHVELFWQALHEFSEEERGRFLRFVWGRSRLPHTLDGFFQKFQLQNFHKRYVCTMSTHSQDSKLRRFARMFRVLESAKASR